MESERAQELLNKYHSNECTEQERAIVESWFLDLAKNTKDTLPEPEYELLKQEYWNRIQKAHFKEKKTIKLWPRIAAVIAIVFCIGIGYSIYLKRPTEEFRLAKAYKNDIAPGGNKATLTSSDGKVITLNQTKTGLAIDAATLVYNDGTKIDPSLLGMTNQDSRSLQVSTPRGGTYSIILQDGTKVWLNSDSKLEFLSNYKNKTQRAVKLIGEAYFEVAKDAKRPFIVSTSGQQVEVLGTHFNINAYSDEPIVRTTLLEGSVKVRGNGEAVTLKPNQQSAIADNGGIAVKQVDPSEALAWKSGRFTFNNTPMQVVMRQIARWYDVEVSYQDESLKNKLLDGSVSRYENVSGILNAISQTGAAKFKIDNHKIIIIK